MQEILTKHSGAFTGKSKVDVQDKYRRMVRKLD